MHGSNSFSGLCEPFPTAFRYEALRAACRIQDVADPGFTLWHHNAFGEHRGDGGQGEQDNNPICLFLNS